MIALLCRVGAKQELRKRCSDDFDIIYWFP